MGKDRRLQVAERRASKAELEVRRLAERSGYHRGGPHPGRRKGDKARDCAAAIRRYISQVPEWYAEQLGLPELAAELERDAVAADEEWDGLPLSLVEPVV